jgi:hypothetical protein
MRWRFIDADITIAVAVTVTLANADTFAESVTRRRCALHQSANDSEPGTAAGDSDAR